MSAYHKAALFLFRLCGLGLFIHACFVALHNGMTPEMNIPLVFCVLTLLLGALLFGFARPLACYVAGDL